MAAAVQLAPGVWRIPTVRGDLLNSYAFREPDGRVTLVDAGLHRAPPRILAGLRAMGSDPSEVTRILLTHTHGDHAGGLAGLRELTGAPPVAVHEEEAGHLRDGRAPRTDRSTLLGKVLRRGPGFTPVAPAETLSDGQLLDVGGGLRVVHTPGHSPGHVSLLHEPTRLLVTGDALFNWRGRVRLSPGFLCYDAAMSQRTAHVLGELDYDVAAFTHGPEIRTGAREAVRGFLRRHGGGR